MSRCASCGIELHSDLTLCPHHRYAYRDDWAAANRIMCDFFHRGKIPRRLTRSERDDEPTLPTSPECRTSRPR
jgi:hypothetical protein